MSEKIYEFNGSNGKHIDVYDDKAVITVKAGLSSFFSGNFSDGEKSIYYADCIGLQFKKASSWQMGYIQFETASGMAGCSNAFVSENSFVWSGTLLNKQMEEVFRFCNEKIQDYKMGKHNQAPATVSPADELKKFKELLDMGAISQEEFDAKKKQLL